MISNEIFSVIKMNSSQSYQLSSPSDVYQYKGVFIYRYNLGDEIHLVASDYIPNRLVKLSLWDKLFARNIEGMVICALSKIYKDIDDLIIKRNTFFGNEGEDSINDNE